MLLGLEPGYRGPDDRLDRSILAGAMAILGTGMAFLVCMLFLMFPDWIKPRDFANGVRTFVARVEVLSAASVSAASMSAASVAVDDGWAANGARPGQVALTLGLLTDPSDEAFIPTSGLSAEKVATGTAPLPNSVPVGLQTGNGLERDSGKSIEGLRDEIGVVGPAEAPEPNSYAAPDGSHDATQTANPSSKGSDFSSGPGSPNGHGSSDKGAGRGKHP